MSAQNLPVKYRPVTLADMVGQETPVETFQQMLATDRLSSTFLIDGHTGTGKTTFARIIARYINCKTNDACGKCASCKAGKSSPDIDYLNAGSDGKIDDIRQLIKRSSLAPMFKYRIVIIDEAHNLTGAAAEALLVPLEEPPPRTIFILCTTDPDKLLATVRSRCTRFSMQPVPSKLIVKRMLTVLKAEKVKVDKEKAKPGLKLIADLSDGSMRYALSMLEAVMHGNLSDVDYIESVYRKTEAKVNVYDAAVATVCGVLEGDIKNAIQAVRSADQRSLIYELQTLLDNVIGKACGYNDGVNYSMRLLKERMRSEKIEFDLETLALYLAQVCSIEWNTLHKTTLMNITVSFIYERSRAE